MVPLLLGHLEQLPTRVRSIREVLRHRQDGIPYADKLVRGDANPFLRADGGDPECKTTQVEDLMFDWLKPILDSYDRTARLKPALLSGLPLVASIVLLIPELGVIWGSIGGLIVYSGGSTLLIQIGRDRGKALEARLYESWGGKPSVAMLRHSDGRLDKPTKERYHHLLTRAVPGLTLSSAEEEKSHPDQADEGYESANSWLLERTRDHDRYALLFKENMNYGFRRNLAGLKPIALAMDVIALAPVFVVAVGFWTGQLATTVQALPPEWWVSLAITASHALFFLKQIRSDWVRFAAETYAHQLLAACDSLKAANLA